MFLYLIESAKPFSSITSALQETIERCLAVSGARQCSDTLGAVRDMLEGCLTKAGTDSEGGGVAQISFACLVYDHYQTIKESCIGSTLRN